MNWLFPAREDRDPPGFEQQSKSMLEQLDPVDSLVSPIMVGSVNGILQYGRFVVTVNTRYAM